jgi:D-alanyl-D-alanine endopeptidase (penicillin-binding protein 7)
MGRILFVSILCTVLCCWGQANAADAKPVRITASSWLVADGNGKVIDSLNPDQQRSIASITKLMTAMTVLDAHQDLNERLDGVSRRELLQLMLVHSDNHAAETLCENYPSGRNGCINAMNLRVKMMGLENTHYADPSGLNIMNVSTAEDLVKIVIESSKYDEIRECAHIAHGTVKKNRHILAFRNTNPLVATHDFIVSKTGYIHASGGCIVLMLDTKIGQRIVVLLNSRNTHTRIPEAYYLATNY